MRKGLAIAAMAVLGVAAGAQEKEDRTLLSQAQMNAIINEAAVRVACALHAQRLNTQPVFDPPQTPEEKDASNLIICG